MSRGLAWVSRTGVALAALSVGMVATVAFDRDGEIQRAVAARLDGDPALSRLSIDVRVEAGRVHV